MRHSDIKSVQFRRAFGQQADLNTPSQSEVALHPLLVNHFTMELRVFERESYVIGNGSKHAFIRVGEGASFLIQKLQDADGLPILISYRKAEERSRAEAQPKIDFRFKTRVGVGIRQINGVAAGSHTAGNAPTNGQPDFVLV